MFIYESIEGIDDYSPPFPVEVVELVFPLLPVPVLVQMWHALAQFLIIQLGLVLQWSCLAQTSHSVSDLCLFLQSPVSESVDTSLYKHKPNQDNVNEKSGYHSTP